MRIEGGWCTGIFLRLLVRLKEKILFWAGLVLFLAPFGYCGLAFYSQPSSWERYEGALLAKSIVSEFICDDNDKKDYHWVDGPCGTKDLRIGPMRNSVEVNIYGKFEIPEQDQILSFITADLAKYSHLEWVRVNFYMNRNDFFSYRHELIKKRKQ